MNNGDLESFGEHLPANPEVTDDVALRARLCGLATPAEAAEYLRTSVGKLANDRHLGTGPCFVKYGRRVLYPWWSLREFVEVNTIRGR